LIIFLFLNYFVSSSTNLPKNSSTTNHSKPQSFLFKCLILSVQSSPLIHFLFSSIEQLNIWFRFYVFHTKQTKLSIFTKISFFLCKYNRCCFLFLLHFELSFEEKLSRFGQLVDFLVDLIHFLLFFVLENVLTHDSRSLFHSVLLIVVRAFEMDKLSSFLMDSKDKKIVNQMKNKGKEEAINQQKEQKSCYSLKNTFKTLLIIIPYQSIE